MSLLPPDKPKLSDKDLSLLLRREKVDLARWPFLVFGIRGYYSRTMGPTRGNDRGIYDDMIGLVTPNVTAFFNGNTDPSAVRRGRGTGAAKGMARLQPGFWPVYRFDLHRGQYLALCQRAGAVTVLRDGSPDYEDTGHFGINIHRGGVNGTSSLGCQTVPQQGGQWDAFIALAVSEAKRMYGAKWRTTTVPYLLMSF
jgi:lysozyme